MQYFDPFLRLPKKGAPVDAYYIVQAPSDELVNEQAISTLGNGVIKHTSGVIAIATMEDLPDGSTRKGMTSTERTKLINIEQDAVSIGTVKSEADISDALSKKHYHINGAQLALITDGDHDIRTDNPHSVNASQIALGNVTNDAQLKRTAGDINSFPLKTTLIDSDIILIEDSADSYNKKKALKSSFGGGGGTPGGANTQVQYNNAGAFGGDSQLVYDPATTKLSVGVAGGNGYTGSLQNANGGSWGIRKDMIVTAPAQDLPSGYSVKLIVTGADAATIFAGGQNALRLEYQVGFVELDRFVETFTSSNITVWFRLQTVINAGQNNGNYRLYYGNTSAGAAPSVLGNVFTKDYEETGINALWHLDDGVSPTVDSSGNGNNAVLTNAPSWQTDDGGQWDGQNVQFATGRHLLFNGSSNYLTIADSATMDGMAQVTFSFWIRRTSSGSGYLFNKFPSGNSAQYSYIMKIDSSNQLLFLLFDGTAEAGGSFVNTIPVNNWSFVAFTYDGATMRTYINGVVSPTTYARTGVVRNTTADVLIGCDRDFGEKFAGGMDEVRIYNRALSAAEINAHYKRRMWVGGDTVAIDGNFAAAGAGQVLGIGSGLIEINSSNASGALNINQQGSGQAIVANGGMSLTAGVPTYADNAAALAGELTVGSFYKTSTGNLMIVY